MQRRIYDYSQYTHLKGLQPMNQFMTISLFVLGIGADHPGPATSSSRCGAASSRATNPWHANTLEWQTLLAAAARELQRARCRRSTAGRTSTARPERGTDYWPQNEPPTGAATPAQSDAPCLSARCTGSSSRRARGWRRRVLLIVAGGLVTSTESGLSVPDWPAPTGEHVHVPALEWSAASSYEHAHRLVASARRDSDGHPGRGLCRARAAAWVSAWATLALAAVVAAGPPRRA